MLSPHRDEGGEGEHGDSRRSAFGCRRHRRLRPPRLREIHRAHRPGAEADERRLRPGSCGTSGLGRRWRRRWWGRVGCRARAHPAGRPSADREHRGRSSAPGRRSRPPADGVCRGRGAAPGLSRAAPLHQRDFCREHRVLRAARLPGDQAGALQGIRHRLHEQVARGLKVLLAFGWKGVSSSGTLATAPWTDLVRHDDRQASPRRGGRMSAARNWMTFSVGAWAGIRSITWRLSAGALICGVALVSPSMPAMADLATGAALYTKKDYEHAFTELLPTAKDGDVVAQFIVGVMYDLGQYVAVDKQVAAGWYKQAADQGYPEAQIRLAGMLRADEGK